MSKFKGMSFGQMVGHFWFYYKWHTIAGIFAIFALTVCLVQCSSEIAADTTVGLYMNRMFNSNEITALSEVLSEYCEDTNGDGQVIVKIYDFSFYETQQDEIKQLNKEKIMSELTGGTCALYITDQYRSAFFDENNIADETEYGKFISLSETNEIRKKLEEKGFKNPEDILFLLRKTEGTVFEKTNNNVEVLLKNPKKILEQASK